MKETYGGSLRKVSEPTEKRAAYWSWDVCGANALKFARATKKFLIVKQRQAGLAIKFQILKSENKNQPCSDRRWTRMTEMYEQMKRFNQKGPDREI